MAQRCPQVMRDGVGKRFELLVGGSELGSTQRELVIELANLDLAPLTLFELDFEPVARVAKIVLHAASNSAEGGNDDRRGHKKKKVGEVCRGNVEGVEWLHKQVVEGCRAQQNGHHGR